MPRLTPCPVFSLAALFTLTGCATPRVIPPPAPAGSVHGVLQSGTETVSEARVYLLVPSSSEAGVVTVSTLPLGAAGSDAFGSYAQTDSRGSFALGGGLPCVPGRNAYLYANLSPLAPDRFSGLLAVFDPCPLSAAPNEDATPNVSVSLPASLTLTGSNFAWITSPGIVLPVTLHPADPGFQP